MNQADLISHQANRQHSLNLERCPKLTVESSNAGSILIHGDNDIAIDVLAPKLNGKVKCVYIDPPYNNMETYTHYEDRDTNDVWLDKMSTHISKLKPLLADDGSLWVSIDDKQVHYLKVVLDGIFGRDKFVTTIVWEHRKTRENRKVFSNNHEYILVYAKNPSLFKKSRNKLPYDEEVIKRYKNPDGDLRGPWQSISLNVQAGHATKSQFFEIEAPTKKKHSPPNGRCWMYNELKIKKLISENRIWFGANGQGVPRLKRFLSEIQGGLTPQTLWSAEEVGTTDSAKKQILKMFPGESVFDTPKPEELIARIVEIATDPGDLVVDTFLGSGTTASVALRAERRFIGVEQGDHILSHCHDRLSREGLTLEIFRAIE